MRLIFIRHGDPDYEKDSVTAKGEREIKLLADKMQSENVHAFYLSPKGRAQRTAEATLARVHSENVLSDIFADSSYKITGAESFDRAMRIIAKEGCGALIYISQADSGIKVPEGEAVAPNMRDYGMGAQILRELGFKKIKLLTTHVGKHSLSEGYGLEITEEIGL